MLSVRDRRWCLAIQPRRRRSVDSGGTSAAALEGGERDVTGQWEVKASDDGPITAWVDGEGHLWYWSMDRSATTLLPHR